MAVFPHGRFDDQVDWTAQFLDWRKMSGHENGIYALYRRRYEALQRERAAGRRLEANLTGDGRDACLAGE
jgi:hypothetical protein